MFPLVDTTSKTPLSMVKLVQRIQLSWGFINGKGEEGGKGMENEKEKGKGSQ